MVCRYHKVKRINPYVQFVRQYEGVRNTYGNIVASRFGKTCFEVVMDITPSENSATYRVKVSYCLGEMPKVILISPELEKRDGKYPHHIYGFTKTGCAKLCVYCPQKNEWNDSMPIATSFIPWISTWLNAYEYWLITDEWHYDEVVNHTNVEE